MDNVPSDAALKCIAFFESLKYNLSDALESGGYVVNKWGMYHINKVRAAIYRRKRNDRKSARHKSRQRRTHF